MVKSSANFNQLTEFLVISKMSEFIDLQNPILNMKSFQDTINQDLISTIITEEKDIGLM